MVLTSPSRPRKQSRPLRSSLGSMGPEPMAGTAWKKGGKTGKNGVRIGGRPREITAQKNSGGKTGSEPGLESKMGEIGTKKGELVLRRREATSKTSPKIGKSPLKSWKWPLKREKNGEITPKSWKTTPESWSFPQKASKAYQKAGKQP